MYGHCLSVGLICMILDIAYWQDQMYDSSSVLVLMSLWHHCSYSCTVAFSALNSILVLAYIPYPLASHCISTVLLVKFDNDQSTEGDGKGRDRMK